MVAFNKLKKIKHGKYEIHCRIDEEAYLDLRKIGTAYRLDDTKAIIYAIHEANFNLSQEKVIEDTYITLKKSCVSLDSVIGNNKMLQTINNILEHDYVNPQNKISYEEMLNKTTSIIFIELSILRPLLIHLLKIYENRYDIVPPIANKLEEKMLQELQNINSIDKLKEFLKDTNVQTDSKEASNETSSNETE